jgi:PST family polysaccharide transporter
VLLSEAGQAAAVAPGIIQPAALAGKLLSVLKSRRRRLGDLSVLLVRRFITGGLAFVTTVQIANVLGKAEYGELAYALALGSYCAVVVRYGLNRTLIRDLTHHPDHFDTLAVASVILRFIMLAIVICGLIVSRTLGGSSSALSGPVILIVVFTSLRSLDLQSVYDAWYEFRRHAAYDLTERCLYFGFIWIAILVIPKHFGLFWIGCATGWSILFYMALQYRWALGRIHLCVGLSSLMRTVVFLLRTNAWIWLSTVADLLFCSFNQIVLRHLKGTQELGGYAVAWQLAVVANMVVFNVSRIGNPATARITRPGTSALARRRFMIKYAVVMLLASMPICLPAMVFPKFLLGMLFRPDYLIAAPIMRVLAVYVLVLSTGIAASQYVISARMDKTYLASMMLGGILAIALNFLLIPRLAGLGAALALLVSYSVFMVACWLAVIWHIARHRRGSDDEESVI